MDLSQRVIRRYREEGLASLIRSIPASLSSGSPLNPQYLYYTRFGTRTYNTDGTNILSEDWDNLIVLDSLRYDYLSRIKDQRSVPGVLEHRISRGSATPEWLYGNFAHRPAEDVVYVTPLRYPRHLGVVDPETPDSRQQRWGFDLRVHDLITLGVDIPEAELDRHSCGVITPKSVVSQAVSATKMYPDKRLIVHFGQPHVPYLGETGEKIRDLVGETNPLTAVRERGNGVTESMVSRAYRENVEIAVDAAMDLVKRLDGRTVISADHGELLGERRIFDRHDGFGHSPNKYVTALVKVPWLVVERDRCALSG